MELFSSDKKFKILLLLFMGAFIFIRLLGVHTSYHQDELRIASEIDQPHGWFFAAGYGHAPLMGFIYSISGSLFGSENMRMFPLIFSIANFILLFTLVKYLFDWTRAIWVVAFFTISYFSLLSALTVDVDGAVLPFFLLLSLLAFYKWREAGGFLMSKWLILFLLFLTAGFLTKFSFILVIAVLILELFYQAWILGNKRLIVKYGLGLVLFLGLLSVVLINAHKIIPNYPLSDAIIHARGYVNFSGRSYFQTAVQVVKVLFFASPLLVAPLLFINKEDAYKLRIFVTFLLSGLIFYLVLFDFSLGALDKYFQFVVVPLSVVGGVSFSRIFRSVVIRKLLAPVAIGASVAVFFFLLQFIPHFVPSLWPKSDWANRVVNFQWNFLVPFTGGSGPVGFYISWLYITLNWISVILLVILALLKINQRMFLLTMVTVLGVGYNLVFAEEYLFGKINGNPTKLIGSAVDYIKNDSQIEKIITYNNIGGYELMKIGKYERRLYVAPKYEPFYAGIFSEFRGHFLVIDIPRIGPNSPYSKYFSACGIIYEKYSQKISSKVYDCRNIPKF